MHLSMQPPPTLCRASTPHQESAFQQTTKTTPTCSSSLVWNPRLEEDTFVDHHPNFKWPNGLSFNALIGMADKAKLLSGTDELSSKPTTHQPQKMMMAAKNANAEETNGAIIAHENNVIDAAEEYLSLGGHSNKLRKVDSINKFHRSFMPVRMSSSSSTSSLDHQNHHAAPVGAQGMERGGVKST